MAKKGMKRLDWTHTQPRNQLDPVPELQGKAKQSKEKAKPIISGTKGSGQKVYHTERPTRRTSTPPSTPIWRGTTWKTISPPPTGRSCDGIHLV